MSQLSVGQLLGLPANNNIITVPSGHIISSSGTIVQVVNKQFSQVTSWTNAQTYNTVSNGFVTITSKLANSSFYVSIVLNGYHDSTDGVNAGISRTISSTTTRLIGSDGASGDAWLGAKHSIGATSYNLNRQIIDSPNVSAGTQITYNALAGKWTTAGTAYINYTGYNSTSTITVMEIAS